MVSQLLHVVAPPRVYLGAKDYQQTLVIEQLVRDLCFDVEVRWVPTVRDADGLAVSSRNARLSRDERSSAPAIYRALLGAREALGRGERDVESLAGQIRREIEAESSLRVEYAEVLDADHLQVFSGGRVPPGGRALIAVAVRAGRTRLIDNLVVPGADP